jgi:hypothetical protein
MKNTSRFRDAIRSAWLYPAKHLLAAGIQYNGNEIYDGIPPKEKHSLMRAPNPSDPRMPE